MTHSKKFLQALALTRKLEKVIREAVIFGDCEGRQIDFWLAIMEQLILDVQELPIQTRMFETTVPYPEE